MQCRGLHLVWGNYQIFFPWKTTNEGASVLLKYLQRRQAAQALVRLKSSQLVTIDVPKMFARTILALFWLTVSFRLTKQQNRWGNCVFLSHWFWKTPLSLFRVRNLVLFESCVGKHGSTYIDRSALKCWNASLWTVDMLLWLMSLKQNNRLSSFLVVLQSHSRMDIVPCCQAKEWIGHLWQTLSIYLREIKIASLN